QANRLAGRSLAARAGAGGVRNALRALERSLEPGARGMTRNPAPHPEHAGHPEHLEHGEHPEHLESRRLPTLRRALGFRDLLFYIVTTFSLRWLATAAAAGPSALIIWIVAAVGLFVPLVFATLELSSRYPEEGGIYVWSKRAFGPSAAFMTGWLYWATNLPY